MAFRVRIEDTEFGRHEYMVNDMESITVSPNCDGRFYPIEPDLPDLDTVKTAIEYSEWDADDLGVFEKDISEFDVDEMYDYIMSRDYRRKEFIKMMKEDGYTLEEV